jgi:alkylated DNA repair dioxygenase AlkB
MITDGATSSASWELADGGTLELRRGWLAPAEADALLARLLDEVPWSQGTVRIAGREVLEPRLTAWFGDPGAVYTYSGRRNDPLPLSPALSSLRERLERTTGHRFNSALANLYRDGRDAMGMHADREPELGRAPVIASISVGAPRRFVLQHRRRKELRTELVLEHGSLLIMGGATQHHFRHGVPRDPAVTAPRVNLTFRLIETAR